MFGERLREARLRKGLTQQQLADMVSVNQSMITQIERGSKQASAPLIAQLGTVLGCTADELVYGQKTIKPLGIN